MHKAVFKDSHTQMMTETQDPLPKIRWGKLHDDNCWRFKYLDTLFKEGEPDGRCSTVGTTDDSPIRQDTARMDGERAPHPITSKTIHRRCVFSTNRSESWNSRLDVQRVINGANSRMVNIVTGRTQKEEGTAGTRSIRAYSGWGKSCGWTQTVCW